MTTTPADDWADLLRDIKRDSGGNPERARVRWQSWPKLAAATERTAAFFERNRRRFYDTTSRDAKRLGLEIDAALAEARAGRTPAFQDRPSVAAQIARYTRHRKDD